MKVAVRVHKGVKYVWYHCPGCQRLHGVPAERWHWNGSEESPTLDPSVRHYTPEDKEQNRPEVTHCHYHIRKGVIEFCGDCKDHSLSGQNIELQTPMDVPDNS